MDIKRTIAITTILLVAVCDVFGQQKSQEIKIGEKLPEIVLKRILNSTNSTVRLEDLYRDKGLIIDFWATWCVPCIREMQFLDSLKSKNPGKFNVLMVTREDRKTVEQFLGKGKKDSTYHSLMITYQDTVLNSFFPHRTIPHNVWIAPNGNVQAITGSEEITTENILAFSTSKKTAKLRTKKEMMAFDETKEFHISDSNFLYRSIITPRIELGNGGSYGGSSAGLAYNRYFQWNGSITHMFWNAFSLYNKTPLGGFKKNLIEVHTKDSLRLFYPSNGLQHLLTGSKYKDKSEWNAENTFCYALTFPRRIVDTVFREEMFKDLERQFNIKAKIENRNVLCNVVTIARNSELKLVKVSKAQKTEIQRISPTKISFKSVRIKDVLTWLFNNYAGKMMTAPFVERIPKLENTYFDLDIDFSDMVKNDNPTITSEMVYFQLKRFGFIFEKKMSQYPILVLYDLNK